jgi:hypothetical protein
MAVRWRAASIGQTKDQGWPAETGGRDNVSTLQAVIDRANAKACRGPDGEWKPVA